MLNWLTGIDMYTLTCIKLMTNENLQYKYKQTKKEIIFSLCICCDKAQNLGFPGGAVFENLPADAGDTGLSPGLGRSHMPRSN